MLLPHLRNIQGFLSPLHCIGENKTLLKYIRKSGPEDDVEGGPKIGEIYKGKVDQRMTLRVVQKLVKYIREKVDQWMKLRVVQILVKYIREKWTR